MKTKYVCVAAVSSLIDATTVAWDVIHLPKIIIKNLCAGFTDYVVQDVVLLHRAQQTNARNGQTDKQKDRQNR